MGICRSDLVVQIQVLLLKPAPILLDVGCRVWEGRVGLLIDRSTAILYRGGISNGSRLLLHLNIAALG